MNGIEMPRTLRSSSVYLPTFAKLYSSVESSEMSESEFLIVVEAVDDGCAVWKFENAATSTIARTAPASAARTRGRQPFVRDVFGSFLFFLKRCMILLLESHRLRSYPIRGGPSCLQKTCSHFPASLYRHFTESTAPFRESS